jgi:DNA invertase Pin-like site-specific DNA recombinase
MAAMTSQPHAAAYVRTYHEEPAGNWSAEYQDRQVRYYAARHGYEITQVYQDDAVHHTDKCSGFERMLFDAQAGLFSAILALHPSRLFHNAVLAGRYTDELRDKLGVEIVFVSEAVPDPAAYTMESLNALFEEYTLHELRTRSTLGKQARAQRGLFNGTLPFGYTLNGDEVPVAHPMDSVGLVMAYEAYATDSYGDTQIAELLNQKGYHTTGHWGERPFTKDTVAAMLQNVFYTGVVKYKGETLPGQHPALIDQDLFDECQAVRASRARPRTVEPQRRIYLLAGIARCSKCGLTLRCHASQSKGKTRYYRHTAQERGYECSAPSKMVRADVIEEQWGDLLSVVRLPAEWWQRIQEQVDVRDRVPDSACPDHLGTLWSAMTPEERRAITQMLLQALYVDVLSEKITAIEPQPDARALFTTSDTDLGVMVL